VERARRAVMLLEQEVGEHLDSDASGALGSL